MIKLYQGDCLEVMKSYSDNYFDCVVTDPPYGLGEWVGKKKVRSRLSIASEWGSQEWDYSVPDPEYFLEMIRISKNQIIFGGNYFTDRLPPSPSWLVWDKQNTGNFADCELAWTSFKSAVRIFRYRWNGMLQGNIQNMKLNEKRVHPTQKPTPLMEWIIENYTKEDDLILDPFMGSGTTGVVCANFKRRFVGVEREQQFFDIASDRISAAENQLTF